MNFRTLLALGVVSAGGLYEETSATQGNEDPVLAPLEDPVYGGLYEETSATQGDEEPVLAPVEDPVFDAEEDQRMRE